MSEIQVCSTAAEYFLLHPRDSIQNSTGPEFVTLQKNKCRKLFRKSKFISTFQQRAHCDDKRENKLISTKGS
jgi:hypothetical protein